jgi:ATPase subunit of ABC transporter with duplicated ATPase domains
MSRLLIQFTHLFKSFGNQPLFDDVSLSINAGDVFALIGENGSGKTSLLNLLSGLLQPDSGQRTCSADLRIGFVPQEVRSYFEAGLLSQLEEQMAACLENPERIAEWGELHEQFERLGGYRSQPSTVDTASLSSGQRMRIALEKALIDDPDLLLLDEPTNHLDLEMQLWLRAMLHKRNGATVIVSHDRKFLNETCNHLIEIKQGKLTVYGGNYDFYLAEQERLAEKEMKDYLAQAEEHAELKQKIKATTFAKAKANLPTDRNFMAYDRRGEKHQKSVQRNLEFWKGRLSEIEANPLPHPKPKSIKGLRFDQRPMPSPIAVEWEGLLKAFGEKALFSNLSGCLRNGDRIVLSSANGAGKTTFMRCLMGLEPIDEGSIRWSQVAKVAYLDQEVELLPMELTPLAYFESRFALNEEALRRALHMAALGGEELIHRPFGNLSVGQRKRLMLLVLVLEKPNVLLLDEPTNHLDFLTLEALEKALLNFEGAIFAISHDQTFIEKIATDVWKQSRGDDSTARGRLK